MDIRPTNSPHASELDDRVFDTLSRLRKLATVLLLVFSAVIIADRLIVPQVPFNVDPAFYAVAAHEVLMGEALYTDIWDHKPPAIFVSYAFAEFLFGYSPQTLVVLNIFVSLIILLGIFYAGKAGLGSIVSGIWAAGLWVILSGTFKLEGRDPNTEPFINACFVWAFAMLVKDRKNGLTLANSITIGLLFLMGTFYKPVVAAPAAFLMVAHVIFSTDRLRAFKDTLLVGLIGLSGWLLMFGYFAATDRYELFYKSIIAYNRFYVGDMWANLMSLPKTLSFLQDFINLPTVLVVAGIVFFLVYGRRRLALLAAYAGSSWIAIALPGFFAVHYFQLGLPPLIIALSWAIGYLAVSKELRLRLAGYSAGAVLALTLVLVQVPHYRAVYAGKWTPVFPSLNAGENTAREINSLLAPDETFMLWGITPNLYLLSGRRLPTTVVFKWHLNQNPVAEDLRKRVEADIESQRPELLVVENSEAPAPNWIADDYGLEPINRNSETYSFYVRRGGRIASQLNSASIEK